MRCEAVDHVVIHVDDWQRTHDFYVGVLGVERIDSPEAAGNPLDAGAYRLGGVQINVHGPWPGQEGPCCPPPYGQVGAADLAFRVDVAVEEVIASLTAAGVVIEAGPLRRFGAGGWGTSVYCRDPSGNGVELLSYERSAP
jgi:catechol 2,3-dioxygenase-like lactoylglutathione lyase family enzyme